MSSWGRTGRVQPVGILILVILFLGVARKIQATGAGSPTPDCSRGAGSLPDPSRPPGTASSTTASGSPAAQAASRRLPRR